MLPAVAPRWTMLLALCTAACQRPSADPVPPDPTQEEASVDDPSGSREAAPAAEPTHPLELVPARARIMMMARSPQRLAQAWERDRLSGQYPEQYGELAEGLQRAFGHDLLDPTQLGAVGIDATAPIGFAVLNIEDEALVFFGGTTDPDRLAKAAATLSPTPPQLSELGSAQLHRLGPELSLVLRHGMFAFVFVDRPHADSIDYALEVARVDPAGALAHAPPMRSAHDPLASDADLYGLLDPAGLIRDEFAQTRRREQRRVADANQRLVEARQRGESPEQLAELQRDIQREEQSFQRFRREQQVAKLLLERTLGSIEGIGMVVDASDRGLLGQIHVALAQQTPLRTILADSATPPAALIAQDREPLMVLAGAFDMDTALELISQLALAGGSSYSELDREIHKELRLQFHRDVRPLLDGHSTFVLTANPDPTLERPGDLGSMLGGAWSVGVTDEAEARAVLDAFVAAWPQLPWTEAPQVGGYEIDVPGAGRSAWLGVVAGRLVVGTDPSVLRRIRDGGAGAAGSTLSAPQAWDQLTGGTAGARLALHHRIPFFAAFSFSIMFDSHAFRNEPESILFGEFPQEDISSIPLSSRTKRLAKKRERLARERAKLSPLHLQERMEQIWRISGGLGMTVGAVRSVDSGWMIDGGHYVRDGMGTYVETAIRLATSDSLTTSVDAKLAEIDRKLEAADQSYIEARREEIQRAITRRAR